VPIDPSVAIGADLGEMSFSWEASDVLLYHLGIGAGADPVSERELRYVYEKNLRVLPSFATVAQSLHVTEAPPKVSFPGVVIDHATLPQQALLLPAARQSQPAPLRPGVRQARRVRRAGPTRPMHLRHGRKSRHRRDGLRRSEPRQVLVRAVRRHRPAW